MGPDQHRPDRPQARHPDRRALPVRARRRSRLLPAGARPRDRARALALRRRAVAHDRRGRPFGAAADDRLPLQRGEAPDRRRHSARRGRGHPRPARLRRRGQPGSGPLVAAGRAGESRRRGADHPDRGPRAGGGLPAPPPRRGRRPARADAAAEAHAPRQAHARLALPARGGDLVVHFEKGRRAVRRRPAGALARQSDRLGPFRHAAEPRSRPRRRGGAQRAPGADRRRPVRGRTDLPRPRRHGPAHGGRRRAARPRQGGPRRTQLARRRPGRRVRRQGATRWR